MSRAPDTHIRVGDDQLVVGFGGWDAVWMLRREVRVPLREIERVTVPHPDRGAGVAAPQ
jgi:hypothetical protein